MITQSELKAITHYDPETGLFTYKSHPSNRCPDGMEIGTIKVKGCTSYKHISWKRKRIAVHRLVFLYMTGAFPKGEVDHIDGNGLNNAWHNLRSVTRSQNRRNSRLSSKNTSGLCGISWHKYKHCWEVKMFRRTIGYADNIFDAACKRISAQNKAGGFTSRHGR